MNPSDLVGAWTLLGITMTDRSGKVVRDASPPEAAGLIIYTADGYVSATVSQPGPDGARSFLHYCGPFSVEGDSVTHHVQIAADPRLHGTKQLRQARLEGDRLTLSASSSATAGDGVSATIRWQRV